MSRNTASDHRKNDRCSGLAHAGHEFLVALPIAASLFSLVGCHQTREVELTRKFQAALQTFDQAASPEDYLRAASLYQEVLDSGVISGALLYNQGNAYMRAGQRGRAIACYRQAKRYLPRDPYLDANLQYALRQVTSVRPSRSVLEFLLFWQDWISYPGKFHLVAAGAVVAFACGAIGRYVPRRQALYRIAWVILAITFVLLVSAIYDWYRYDFIEHGVVIRGEAVARKGNAQSYEPAFTKPLDEGTEFTVVEQRGAWVLIRLAGAHEGWVKREDVITF